MFELIKKASIALLSFSGSLESAVKIPDSTKYISLNNQPCITRPTLINQYPGEQKRGLCYNPFLLK